MLNMSVMKPRVQACDTAEVFAQCLQGNFNNPHIRDSATTTATQDFFKRCYFSTYINTYVIPAYSVPPHRMTTAVYRFLFVYGRNW
jgi:hypothetical protein